MIFKAKNLLSEDESNPEYDRGILELVNELLERDQVDILGSVKEFNRTTRPSTADLLGMRTEYVVKMYGVQEADSAPIFQAVRGLPITPSATNVEELKEQLTKDYPAGPKFHHVVMPHGTVTFLDHDAALEFVGDRTVDEADRSTVMCESEVTGEEYNRVCEWRGATS